MRDSVAMERGMQAPLVPVTLACLSGILLGTYARLSLWSLVIAGVVSACVALWRWKRARFSAIALLLLWVCLGMLRVAVWRLHPAAQLERWLPEEPQHAQLHGMILDDPTERHGPHGRSTHTCALEVRHVRSSRGWQPMVGRLHVSLALPSNALAYGDDVLLEGVWSRVSPPSNPGQYDWRAALARQRMHGQLRVRPCDGIAVLRHGSGSVWADAVFALRRRWERLIGETFDARDAGLLRSFLLGQRVALDESLQEAFVQTGTIHLVVISGFNVGLVAGILELFLRLIGLPWRIRLLVVAISLGGYCLLTGLQPPVARATIMAWIVLGALACDRVLSWSNALAAAALVILWINPTQLFDPGFQLSFGAVASLLVFVSRGTRWLEPRLSWLRPAWLRRYLTMSVAATGAIWVGLSPLLAWYFYLVAPISVLANLLLAPLVSALVSLGTALLALGTIAEVVMRWGGGALVALLRAIRCCVGWCHAVPGGSWFVGHPSPWWLLGYYSLIGLSILRSRLNWSVGRVLICWAAGLAVWCWVLVASHALASRWLWMEVLDVGHGDAIVVHTPRGYTLVVDAGSQEAGRMRLVPFLRRQGITTVDALVLTHTDEDHVGGAIPLLEQVRVKRLLTNGSRGDTMSARLVMRLAKRQRIRHAVIARGMSIAGDPFVRIDVLHPPRGLVPGTIPASNDNCIVLKVTYKSVSFLLTGDIEGRGLPRLLRAGKRLRSTVLIVPHHGSRLGGAGTAFFNAVRPQLAMLSVGRLHHLPAPETVRDLAQLGSRLYSTRDDGALAVRTDGLRLAVQAFARQDEQEIFNFGF